MIFMRQCRDSNPLIIINSDPRIWFLLIHREYTGLKDEATIFHRNLKEITQTLFCPLCITTIGQSVWTIKQLQLKNPLQILHLKRRIKLVLAGFSVSLLLVRKDQNILLVSHSQTITAHISLDMSGVNQSILIFLYAFELPVLLLRRLNTLLWAWTECDGNGCCHSNGKVEKFLFHRFKKFSDSYITIAPSLFWEGAYRLSWKVFLSHRRPLCLQFCLNICSGLAQDSY